MKISKFTFFTKKKEVDLHAACVADLHARPCADALKALELIRPKVIFLPGDILEVAAPYREKRNKNGLEFLKRSAQIAPTYYTYGNHEIYYTHTRHQDRKIPDPKMSEEYIEIIRSYGVHIINDEYRHIDSEGEITTKNDISVGGLVCGRDMDPDLKAERPDLDFLYSFEALTGYKILLCHYPHYYEKYLKDKNVDLILSGHAHGGQWRIFGRGIYAPHQGLFPEFTSGLHDGKMLISRGVANNVRPIPRFFNSCEVLDIRIESK